MLTRAQLNEKIAATLAELGLSLPETNEIEIDGDTVGLMMALDHEEVEKLDLVGIRKLEDLKYELTAAVNGTDVTWRTIPVHPDDVRNKDGEEGHEEQVVTLETSAQDLKSMCQVAQLGVALADMIIGLIDVIESDDPHEGGRVLHQKMEGALKFAQSVFPSPLHMAGAVHKTNELGHYIQESWQRNRAAHDLEGLEALSEGLTVEEFLATAATDGKKEGDEEDNA